MPYATRADLTQRFGAEELIQLTDRALLGTVDAPTVAAALADADAAIEGYLAARYAVPVSPVPALLRRVGCDISRFFLHGNAAPEPVRQAYEDALRVLKDLADGRAVLVGAAAAASGAVPAASPGTVRLDAPSRGLDRASLGDYLG